MLVSLMLVIQIFSYIRLQGVILGSGSFSTFFIIKCFSAQKYSLGESCVVSSGPITSYQSSVTPFESMLSGVELTGTSMKSHTMHATHGPLYTQLNSIIKVRKILRQHDMFWSLQIQARLNLVALMDILCHHRDGYMVLIFQVPACIFQHSGL
ncbi:uncharacterized protein LOC108195765 isoform X2 [Daucus carota subsp. sativus]|uniref:uncharacterized protein LOC108195765 isoform X2 n=1 Tax=Daucus carota subsp. sativus TaxID=79200 RepID=UPI00308272C0